MKFKAAESKSNVSISLRRKLLIGAGLCVLLGGAFRMFGEGNSPNMQAFKNPSGELTTFSATGFIDSGNPFFQNLGTNGRTCSSCHQASDGWTVTPAHIQARFDVDGGLDPIFRTNDGANCPSADVSTVEARRSAYSLLLAKGLIRVSLPVPTNAEFVVATVDDPNTANVRPCPETTKQQLAMFRRPLPSSNLEFLSTVMWDGRETVKGQSIDLDLMTQAKDATLGHAQAAQSPTDQQAAQIVAFEKALFTAQSRDNAAGVLNAQGAAGGPFTLSNENFYLGINDTLGGDPNGAAFNPAAFSIFSKWRDLASSKKDSYTSARQSVARGEDLFNHLPITINGVAGLNDLPGLSTIAGTCTSCHDSPNVGNHSVSLAINIGVTDSPALPPLDTTGLPVYQLVCTSTGRVYQVTDPGRAMVTGKCADIGKTKGPILRGLAARAPYFHNGSAATLMDVVNFYDIRFQLNLTQQQKDDLVAFLNSL
jgi:cytochrome c peroxidase